MKNKLEETKKVTGFQLTFKLNHRGSFDVTLIDKTNKCEVKFEDVRDFYLCLEGMRHTYNAKNKLYTKEV